MNILHASRQRRPTTSQIHVYYGILRTPRQVLRLIHILQIPFLRVGQVQCHLLDPTATSTGRATSGESARHLRSDILQRENMVPKTQLLWGNTRARGSLLGRCRSLQVRRLQHPASQSIPRMPVYKDLRKAPIFSMMDLRTLQRLVSHHLAFYMQLV